MSFSAATHVIAYLTRPLLSKFTLSAVTTAQLILNASLISTSSATFALSSQGIPPPAIYAASIGAGIPWAEWLAALSNGEDILLFYGPGYVKVRIGDAPVTDVWNEDAQGSIVPISQRLKATPPTNSRLQAMLSSARARSMRRAQRPSTDKPEPIRIPSLLLAPTPDSESDSSSDSDSDCSDSDCMSSTSSSKLTSYSFESLTSAADSPPATPPKSSPLELLPAKPVAVSLMRPSKSSRAVLVPAPAVDSSRKDTTAYIYQGGVTRVMTGGVMLGSCHRHVVRAKRS